MRKIDKSSSDGILLSSRLQQGVWVEFLPGETVTAFILRVLSLQEHEMKGEVQTLMLNNGCVDDPDTTALVAGDTLVLSGAMPGLVGAMLRSNSPIKAMRQSLSGTIRQNHPELDGDFVRIKLFNSILVNYREEIKNVGFYIEDEE